MICKILMVVRVRHFGAHSHNLFRIAIGRVRHKPGSVLGVVATTLAVIYLGYLLPNTSCGTHLAAIA